MKIVVANCFTHEEFMCWARLTIVGRWSPCPVLQQPAFIPQHPALRVNIINSGGVLEDGARRPPSYLKYALFVLSAFAAF